MQRNNCKKIITTRISSLDEINYFSMEITDKNPELNILNSGIIMNQGVVFQETDISGYISLQNLFCTIPPGKKTFTDIIEKCLFCINKAREFFLDPRNLLLDFENIFVPEAAISDIKLIKNLKFIYQAIDVKSDYDPLTFIIEEIITYSKKHFIKKPVFLREEIEYLESLNIDNCHNFLKLPSVSERTGIFSKNFDSIHGKLKNKLLENQTHVLISAVMFQLFFVFLAFLIMKNQFRFESQIVPIFSVMLIILICVSTDLFLLFSRSSPISINPLFLFSREYKSSGLNSEITPDRNKVLGILSLAKPDSTYYKDCIKYTIITDDFLIGSNKTKSDLHLEMDYIDDIHARITRKEITFFIEDYGSENGTFINGKKLKKEKEYILEAGSSVRFGLIEFYFSVDRVI